MVDRNRVRLVDLTLLVPGDIEIGIIKCKSGRKIEFHDISELSLQYQLDTVEGFDIKSNYFGERALIVYLAHN